MTNEVMNMERICLMLLFVLALLQPDHVMASVPEQDRSMSETEYGVTCIQRICPTVMWDSWTFRDIMYDKESKTVLLVVQLANRRQKDSVAQPSEEKVRKQAEWIVSNVKEAYRDLTTSSNVQCDGDFMLYLSLGQLLKKMEKEGVGLQIMLLKPDYRNQVFGDIPMRLTSEQIGEVKVK